MNFAASVASTWCVAETWYAKKNGGKTKFVNLLFNSNYGGQDEPISKWNKELQSFEPAKIPLSIYRYRKNHNYVDIRHAIISAYRYFYFNFSNFFKKYWTLQKGLES